MQQLLNQKANTTDGFSLRQLFIQRLPPIVPMVLASTADIIDELAKLASKLWRLPSPLHQYLLLANCSFSQKWNNFIVRSQTFKSPSNGFPHISDEILLVLVHPAQPHNNLSQTSVGTI